MSKVVEEIGEESVDVQFPPVDATEALQLQNSGEALRRVLRQGSVLGWDT